LIFVGVFSHHFKTSMNKELTKISTTAETRPNPDREPLQKAPATSPRRRRTLIVVAIIGVLTLGVIWWLSHRDTAQNPAGGNRGGRRGGFGGPNAPLPVGVLPAQKGDIPIYLNALGTITPAHMATIRTQISGQLQQIAFHEGQLVHEHDLLAVIDPRPYQNALEQAQAQSRQAQSQLQTAQLDLQRYNTLANEDSIAKQQVDTTRAQVSQFESLAQAAQAAIDTAKLNLTYCHITAPFDGRVGLRFVDTGNYVTPGDANGIVVLAQVKPINVIFTLPEDNIGTIVERYHSGAKLLVEAFDRTQSKKLATGELVTIDNQIDPTTGTFKLRAEFQNEDESLFPNQFVNVRVLLDTIHDATVVPSSAVERGQQGTFVYVVGESETAIARPVTLGVSEGEQVAITSGLEIGENVVVDGADRLKDGQKVILPSGSESSGRSNRPAGGAPGDGRTKHGDQRKSQKAAPDSGNRD